MFEIFGIPSQALFGQLLLGLINGSFYALLSLGLAVIFGMLNIINFAHGAQYMMGAFAAYLLLHYLGINYWAALVIAPIGVGATGVLVERLFLQHLRKLDPLYGLLVTFGLALVIEGLFRNGFGSSGLPYEVPAALSGGRNLGFMFLPNYRAWVIVLSLAVCLATWFAIERTRLGSYLRAATENPVLVRAFGINVPRMVTLDLRFRRRPRGARRRYGGADLQRLAADGLRPDHRGVRCRRDWRHGVDHGRDRHRVCARHRRRPDEGILSGGLEHRCLCRHGDRAAHSSRRAVRAQRMMERVIDPSVRLPRRAKDWSLGVAFAAMVVLLAIGPFVLYPVFLMKALCFALFACAFNLLIGYVGLLSFGHAMFFGWASYLTAYAAKGWGLSPEPAILIGTATAAGLGIVTGYLAIRRQGIYFAMITLALAQMTYFFALQAKFTGGEDGIQGVPRGRLFGVFDLSNEMTMYVFILIVVLAGFLFIYRIINSPFGEVLKAIRENEQRAVSLGYKTERYKLVAFVLSATLAGLAGSLNALVFQLASLTDVHWTMSGDVVLMTLLGGLGTVFGPVVGAFLVIAMQNYLAPFGQWVLVIQGAIFIACVLAFRRGIVGEIARLLRVPL